MDVLADFIVKLGAQLQSPTLAFLVGGMVLAACGSKLQIPDQVYRFIVFMLLMRIGLKGGMAIREADLAAMLVPAAMSALLGAGIVLAGSVTIARLPGVRREDGLATAGLFGAVSASTLAAAMALMEAEGMAFEAWVPALYPFMDIPALILAIVLADLHVRAREGRATPALAGAGSAGAAVAAGRGRRPAIWPIVRESLQGSALSALLLGLALGLVSRPERVVDSFYDPLFRGLLSVLMLVMGIEAWARLAELRRVAHWYAVYAVAAPLLHGLAGFGLGWLAHQWTGFSPGGAVLLGVIAASSSDISGPPTLRAGIPSANPSAYIGASTSLGTPVAVAIVTPLLITLGRAAF